MQHGPILKPGHNCWRICPADQVTFLIDGADYFNALHEALQSARRQALVLAWDIYSHLKLEGESATDRTPELGELLNQLVDRERELRVYILGWDFSMLFALDREWIPIYHLGWNTHRRVRFELESRCPTGSSHHQKVVVIDDLIAFCGGLDLTRGRWDTPDHRPDDPRRENVAGTRVPPLSRRTDGGDRPGGSGAG